MKNFFNKIMGLGLLLFSTLNLNAQTEPQVAIGETIIFPHQDSLSATLERFGIRLIDFPEWATQCPKSKPKLPDGGKKSPWEPYIDTTKVVHRPGTDSSLLKKSIEKNIVWVHGLNGSKNSLYPPAYATQNGATDFPARIAKCHGTYGFSKEQIYSENYGITPAAFDVNYFADKNILVASRTNEDFVIGHSQGGIVAREWLRKIEKDPANYPNLVHGLVTFGTPHGGAMVLNNCRPNLGNKVPDFMNNACSKLSKPLVSEIIKKSLITRLIVSDDMKNKLSVKACEFLSDNVVPLAFDNYYKRTTLDYYVGSPFLEGYNTASGHEEGLSEYTLNVPVVQFYGEEKQPILWKFLSSTIGIGEDALDNKEVFFGHSTDDQIEKKVTKIIDEMQAKENFQNEQYQRFKKAEIGFYAAAIISFKNPFGVATYLAAAIIAGKNKNNALEYKNEYQGAKDWYLAANDLYLTELIGAKVTTTSLECKFIDVLQCRSANYNPVGSGIPAVDVTVRYSFDSKTGTCYQDPINKMYQNYHFKGHNNGNYNGPCTGTRQVIATWKNTYEYKANDGVVLAESAGKSLKVKNGLTYRIYKMPETNHEQMKNSLETQKALTKLYDNNVDKVFSLPKR